MSSPPDPAPMMRWWGWGDPAHGGGLPDEAFDELRAQIGAPDRRTPPVPAEDVRVGERELPSSVQSLLAGAVGEEWVRDDREARILHAAGKGYPDLIRMRGGHAEPAPEAVVYPAGEEEVRRVLEICGSERVAVVPFGGGTSVVGGVEPVRDGLGEVVCLDMSRIAAVGMVDERSLTAVIGAGARGPDVERSLGAAGYTLGHFPQSFEYSSVGGWVATRSAGQASTGYGTIEKLVTGLRLASPVGEVEAHSFPASAAGPKLREMLVGSEGVLGVITESTLQVRRAPSERRYEGWMFRSFEEGAEALRALEQGGAVPDVARLLDEDETRLSLMLAGSDSATARVGRRYIKVRGYAEGCLGIVGWEGDRAAVDRRRALGTWDPEALGRAVPWHFARQGLGAVAFRGPVPARLPDGPRPVRRDARDRDALVRPHGAARGRPRRAPAGARRPRDTGPRRLPHLAPVSERRVAVLHVHRAARGRGATSTVAGRQVGGL